MFRDDLARQLHERVLRYAASRLQRDVAEDLAQETMLLLHQKYAHLEDADSLLPVAFQVLRFKLAAARRKAHRRGEDTAADAAELDLPAAGDSPEEAAARNELLARFQAALRRAPERCRHLMRLKLLGWTFEQIRVQMGAKSINTVYTWDARCRQRLMEEMERG